MVPDTRLAAPCRRAWRRLASAFLFGLLGVGGVLLSLTAVPVLWLLPARLRRRRARRLIHHSFRVFVWGLERFGLLRVEAGLLPAMDTVRGALVVANHPTWLDAVVLLARWPDAVCLVKPAVVRNPFFGALVRTAGFPDVDPGLAQAERALREGLTVLCFPEGTRSTPGQPVRFQRGAAHLASRTGVPVIPILIQVEPLILGQGGRWYTVPLRTSRFRACGRPPFSFAPPPAEDPGRVLQAREMTQAMEAFYNRELHGHQPQHDGRQALHHRDPRPGGRDAGGPGG